MVDRNPESRLILACLEHRPDDARKIICGEKVSLRRLSRLADKNLIRAALAEGLLELALPARFPRAFFEKTVLQNSIARDILLQQAIRCRDLLAAAHVPMLLLKGLTLPSGHPRDIGDLDILVPPHLLEPAMEALSADGYRYIGSQIDTEIRPDEMKDFRKQTLWNNQYQFAHGQTGLIIELHTNLFQSGRVVPENLETYLGAIGEIWKRKAGYEKLGLDGLCPEDLFLLMCVHGSIKRCPGKNRFALRTVLDLEALAEAGLDWPLVLELADRYRIGEHLLLSLRIALHYRPGIVPAAVMKKLAGSIPLKLRLLSAFQLRSFRGMGRSRALSSYLYRVFMPFFYRGTLDSRIGFSVKAVINPLRKIIPARTAETVRHA